MEKVNEVSEGRSWMLVLSGQSRVQLAPGWGHTCPPSPAGMALVLPRWDTGDTEGTEEAEMGPGRIRRGQGLAVEAEPLQLPGCECCR